MILTTTVLVIVTVVGSAALNVVNVRKAFDDSAQRQVETFRAGRETLGEFGTPLFAQAVSQLLFDRGRDVDILHLVEQTVGQDTHDGPAGRKDYGLKLAYVLDLHQKVVALCSEGAGGCQAGNHEAVTDAFGPLTVETWREAQAAWKTSAAGSDAALVRFEHARDGSRYRVFAFPVFAGAEPTASGALAPEAPDTRLGYVVLGYDLAPLEWFTAAAAEQKATASRRAALYTAVVGALFVLIGTILAILQGLSISRPIKQLAWRAEQIARGDLLTRVDVRTRDEIGVLGESFNFMADQIHLLLQQAAEKARMDQELEVARAIQETLVPGPDPVHKEALEFAGFYLPAAQTGGDWWTWHELTPGKYLLVIGDVTGHGVPSAMITAAAKAACDVARHLHGESVSVTQLLEIMNHAIYESAQRRLVMTCFASIVDTRARTITYANAGHNFPYLFRQADGKGEFGSLMIRGNRLGDDRTSTYEAKTTELRTGDVLVWYTDGIVECENPEGAEYGEKRFRASVRRAAALTATEMRDSIVADASAFYGEMPRKDDITMIVGRIR